MEISYVNQKEFTDGTRKKSAYMIARSWFLPSVNKYPHPDSIYVTEFQMYKKKIILKKKWKISYVNQKKINLY